jgi:pimeloyl-ACP methyl ester carboxylesterase
MSRVDLPAFSDRTDKIGNEVVHFVEGGSGYPIVLLHGWGGRIASFGAIPASLAERFHVVAVDLPGFGESPLPLRPWNIRDFADCIAALLARLGNGPVTLVGHSHGGRIGISVAAHYPKLIRKLVLVDSAGILPARGPRYYRRVYLIKTIRRLLGLPGLRRLREPVLSRVYRAAGSSDYAAASNPILRATLVKVVNDDLRPLLPRIKAPTLLIWGTEDRETPLADGRLMNELIPDSGLVELEGSGHFSYLEQPDRFCRILTHFVEH